LPVVEYLERRRTDNVGTYVFPGQGDDNAFGSFPNHWKHLFEDSPLSDITPHVLRHSFASIANDLGFTEVTIAALVGHAKGSVTSKYIHTLDTALIMAADTISGYVQGLLDGIEFKQTAYALDRDSRKPPWPRFLKRASAGDPEMIEEERRLVAALLAFGTRGHLEETDLFVISDGLDLYPNLPCQRADRKHARFPS
jgi:hypothetical protein